MDFATVMTARGRRTPVLLQSEAAECGLACLAMIASRYGHRMNLAALRRYYNLSLKGMTLRDIMRVASSICLATRALRVEMDYLSRLRLPCILHWDHNHFVVLVRIDGRRATVHDPAIGRRRVPLAELSRHFTGVALEAWPTEGFERRIEQPRIRISDLIRRTEGFGRAALQVLIMSLVLELIVLAVPIGFQLVLDDVIPSDDRNLLLLVAVGLGILVAFRALTDFVRSWSMMAAGSRLTLQWKLSLFSHLLRLPLGFFERRHVGDVASRFGSIDQIQKTLTSGPIAVLVDGVMAIGLLLMMWLYAPRLAVIALLTTAAYAALWGFAYTTYRTANKEAIACSAQENSHFLESLRGMSTIKALVLGECRQAAWTNFLVDRVSAELRVQQFQILFGAGNTLLFGLDRVLIVYFGASAVLSGSLSIGMLVAFIAYKDQFSQRVARFLDTSVQVGMLTVHGERIADIGLAEAEQRGQLSALPGWLGEAGGEQPALRAQGICFRYGDNEPDVLTNVDVEVAHGECVALVGPSGGGKTTLLKILAGLLNPTSGTVYRDGVPVRTIGLEAYRSQIGCVLQDDRLFAGSIAENIAGFSPTPDLGQVQEAAQVANIHQDILRMPMGYDTLVGDMGSTLSGGQMQRIILARALYRRPRILLLDEATSHLDEENEAAINRAVQLLPIARVIVAHRRSTFGSADRVLQICRPAANPAFRPGPLTSIRQTA